MKLTVKLTDQIILMVDLNVGIRKMSYGVEQQREQQQKSGINQLLQNIYRNVRTRNCRQFRG